MFSDVRTPTPKLGRKRERTMRSDRKERRCHSHMSGVALGFVVIAAGVLLMLSHMGIVLVNNIWDLWPSAIAALGVVKLFSCPYRAPSFLWPSR